MKKWRSHYKGAGRARAQTPERRAGLLSAAEAELTRELDQAFALIAELPENERQSAYEAIFEMTVAGRFYRGTEEEYVAPDRVEQNKARGISLSLIERMLGSKTIDTQDPVEAMRMLMAMENVLAPLRPADDPELIRIRELRNGVFRSLYRMLDPEKLNQMPPVDALHYIDQVQGTLDALFRLVGPMETIRSSDLSHLMDLQDRINRVRVDQQVRRVSEPVNAAKSAIEFAKFISQIDPVFLPFMSKWLDDHRDNPELMARIMKLDAVHLSLLAERLMYLAEAEGMTDAAVEKILVETETLQNNADEIRKKTEEREQQIKAYEAESNKQPYSERETNLTILEGAIKKCDEKIEELVNKRSLLTGMRKTQINNLKQRRTEVREAVSEDYTQDDEPYVLRIAEHFEQAHGEETEEQLPRAAFPIGDSNVPVVAGRPITVVALPATQATPTPTVVSVRDDTIVVDLDQAHTQATPEELAKADYLRTWTEGTGMVHQISESLRPVTDSLGIGTDVRKRNSLAALIMHEIRGLHAAGIITGQIQIKIVENMATPAYYA
ncbi:MAG: hypothetical protein PHS88_08235, partial [Candidatus Omnitrophica bacterium]|nr:hypothetical protein [Candidatus Omnitrophota bacterium]